MRHYTDIQENWALSALMGNVRRCVYATEKIGYIARLWTEDADGMHTCEEEKYVPTYAAAKQWCLKAMAHVAA